MKKLVILSLMFFLLIGCKKKTEVSGVVYNKRSGLPYPGCKFTLVEEDNVNRYPLTVRDMGKSDANGKYHFSFTAKRKYSYYFTCESPSDSFSLLNNINYKKFIELDIYLDY